MSKIGKNISSIMNAKPNQAFCETKKIPNIFK